MSAIAPRSRPEESFETNRTGHIVTSLLGFVLTFVAFYPGLMSPDSDHQLMQARRFAFSDGHPVIMALIWAGTNRIWPGPQGFFLLLLLMYWVGFFLVARYFAPRSHVAHWMAVVLPFMPFLINFSGTLWKDALVFDCFLLSLGIILCHSDKQRRLPIVRSIAVAVLLAVGSLARHNSALAAIPLLVFLRRPHSSYRDRIADLTKSFGIASLIVVVSVVALNVILAALLRPEKTHPTNQLMLFDLVGISHRVDKNLLPGQWTDDETRSILNQCYEPRTWDSIWLRCDFAPAQLRREGQWSRLSRPWIRAIRSHPLAYAAHRVAYVGWFFASAHLVFNWQVTNESIEHGFTGNLIFRFLKERILGAASTYPFLILFTKAFWFVTAPIVFLIHLRLFGKHPVATYPGLLVSASAFLYTAPLAIVGIAHDFRYVYWGIGATCLALVCAVDGWHSSTRAGGPTVAETAPAGESASVGRP